MVGKDCHQREKLGERDEEQLFLRSLPPHVFNHMNVLLKFLERTRTRLPLNFIIDVGLGIWAIAINYKGRSLTVGKVYVKYHYLQMAECLVKTKVN